MSEVLYKQRPYQQMHERAKMLIEKIMTPQFEVHYGPLRPLHTPFPAWQARAGSVVNVLNNNTAFLTTASTGNGSGLLGGIANNTSTEKITQRVEMSNTNSPSATPNAMVGDRESTRAFESLRKLMIRSWHENAHERPSSSELLRLFKLVAAFRDSSFMDLLVKKMEAYASNLESIVRARTAELVEETKRADLLLREILPSSVVQQLKAGKSVEPEFFESTTIFFSDIVQFTRIASMLNPLQVVSLLNGFCVFMDDIISCYQVYKVETIGDGYLVVSGLPLRCRDHAAQIARMALEMRARVGLVELPITSPATNMDDAEGEKIRLRIGINTGPCVAGVVGLKMPRYCLFGDAVNVASRMESNGQPMRIHISESTKLELDRFAGEFQVEERGLVFIKGKGDMLTFWLQG